MAKFRQNLPKSYQVSHHNRYILLQLGNFIEILIKSNNLLWYKSINITYRSFQDVCGYKIVKLHNFLQNAKIYLFCKLSLNQMNLKGPVKFKFHKSTIVAHSTIADSQHREFLTFLTSSPICCFSAACVFLTIHVTLIAINCSIQATCERTAPEVLRHVHVIVKQIHKG